MINAYDKSYLEKARTVLGRMLDFAVYELQYNLETFWKLFLTSDIAGRFANGDFTILVGKSGVEVAYEVLEQVGIPVEHFSPRYTADRSEEYWTGWALAYFQWESSLPFYEITKYVPITQIRALYSPYHEMDIRQFCDEMRRLYRAVKPDTNLKLLRKAAGLSQQGLAELSGVPARTIQQYEQRQKNINKANAEHLLLLSRALHCDIAALLEPDETSNI